MMKNKKPLLLILSLIFLISFGGLIACNNSQGPTTQPEQPQTAHIVLEQTNIQLTRGEQKTIKYTLENLEGTPEWYSFDENVAIVDKNTGKITGVELGSTVIVAYIGEISASCNVLVSEKAVEVKELKINLTSSKVIINAESEFNSMNLSASVSYNNQEIDAQVSWKNSNSQAVSLSANGNAVTITALENNTSAIVTATVTYEGVTVSVDCLVICQSAHAIVFDKEQIKLFPTQSEVVQFDLYVDGVKNDQEKSSVRYSINDTSVATVDENGKITAVKKGTTQLVLDYKGRQFSMGIEVGEDVYVSTARQFMDIDGEQGYVRYILQNDVDLSGYFKENPSINKSSLIDNFGGVIDGRGYTVSGWHRLKNANDVGFKGIFNLLTSDAKISNLGVKLTIDTDVKAIAIANNSTATIENCVFDLTFNSNKPTSKVLFSVNNGGLENTIIKITNAKDGDVDLGVSDSGIAVYEGVSLIASTLTYGAPNGIMVNDNFSDCYYYASQTDFEGKEGFVLDGNGLGQSTIFENSNYDQSTFVVDGDIYLINQNNTVPFEYSDVAVYAYQELNVGEQTQIQLPTVQEGQTVTFKVLDYSLSDVTYDVCTDGQFTANYEGEYYVIVYVLENGVYSCSMSTIKVVKELPEINAVSVVLGNGVNEHTITVDGKNSSEYSYYSSNEKIATVSETGVVTAIAEGKTTVNVIEKNGQSSYKVLVTVINSYTEVSDYDSLVLALNNAIKGDYVVLTSDITIEQTPLQYRYDENGEVVTHNGTPVPHAFVVNSFKGILDGQGYQIHLKFNSGDTDDYLMCGLFYKIEVGAEIKNLHYTFTANYVPTGKYATYSSTFTRNCSGVIRSCYLESYLYPTVSSGGMEGIIGYLSNKSISQPTAYVYDTLFKLQTEVDGVIQDGGHAIRAATSNPYGYNNALIRNSSNNEFYGTCSFTSALEGSGNIKYNTLYDFVNGKDGYFKSVLSVITKVSNGNIVYADWGGEWDISEDEIRLCGKKVADVYFEEYNTDSSISIEDNNGVLSWAKEIGAVDIYINGQLKLSQSNNTFAIYDYVKSNYQPFVGEYKVIISNGTKAGAVLYKVIELNNDNFVEVLRASNTKESATYKYYVFGEDITLDSWNGTDRGDFIGGATQAIGYHVFDHLYGNVDGLGHSLNVSVNTYGTTDRFGGFIGNNRCSWKNVVYNLKATYSAQAFGLFATNSWAGVYENCYFNISATKIDSTGAIVPDESTSVINTPRGSKFKDCIIAINQTEGSSIMFLGDEIAYPVFENVIFIRDTESSLFTLSQSDKWLGRKFINCYHYRTLEDFVNGDKGVLIDVPNDVEYKTTEVDGVISYANFGDVWTINGKGVKLFDNLIVEILDTGDNIVNDEDIL